MKKIATLLSLLFFAAVSNGQKIDLVLGNPTDAQHDETQADNYLLEHATYVLSFNRQRETANWVAWHLQASDMGKAKRKDMFRPDTTLPADWQINGKAFGKPYDRGHMCPSGERTNNQKNNSETFLMSNMQPQQKTLNEQTWEHFEAYIQQQARSGLEAYEYAGCYGDNGKLKNGMTIPTHCWKIVLFLKKGSKDLDRIDNQTRVVAVDMPNDGSTAKVKWDNYRTTVAAIESSTGFRFFTTLPPSVKTFLRSHLDTETIPKKKTP